MYRSPSGRSKNNPKAFNLLQWPAMDHGKLATLDASKHDALDLADA